MREPIVYMLPKMIKTNKFNELLSQSIEDEGWDVKHFSKKDLRNVRKNDVLHFHWPSFYYKGNNAFSTFIKSILFILMIVYVRLKGAKLFWTVHNIWPHNSGRTWHDYWMRTFLVRNCTKLIVMGKPLIRSVCETFHVKESLIEVIPHGHYQGVYGRTGQNIRELFNIPANDYVFAFFGQVSPYKGVDDLIKAFNHLDWPDAHLLIAGKKAADYDLEASIGQSDRIHTYFNFIQDGEYSDYFEAIDSMILPYKNIATSGSAILALSYGKPVVAPRIGLMEEYLPENCAVLYDPADQSGLEEAMKQIRAKDDEFREGKGFQSMLEKLEWSGIAKRTISLYAI
ncbi:hypothetical protein ASD24_23340 [Paenibacillus sp. Root52]|uniref:glycosyltransferase n=1 Tax=unclassified Paenibacillus TaxID=185978 RepID=UPI0006F2C68F|nr:MULTISPECIES: glycosyltransferase [unclassified Paenibacillus]KQY91668.1 hypothetical protein ASD24_23340 [Paenibacillus sp. Root52]MCG7377532.1 glycosyltransferase [Paenibacillus sp. ACRSA]